MAEIKNLPASVRQRLTNIADSRSEPLQRMLVRYGLERLLYRLSRSKHRERFVLKGALLFSLWSDTPQRPTMDADLMSAASADVAELVAMFKAICATPVEDDGLVFPPVADAAKQKQWSSFLSKSGVVAPTLPEIARLIETFLSSPTLAAARREGFRAKWMPSGPWRDSKSE